MSTHHLEGCVYHFSVLGLGLTHGNHGRGAIWSLLGTDVSEGALRSHAWDPVNALLYTEVVFHSSNGFQAILSASFFFQKEAPSALR